MSKYRSIRPSACLYAVCLSVCLSLRHARPSSPTDRQTDRSNYDPFRVEVLILFYPFSFLLSFDTLTQLLVLYDNSPAFSLGCAPWREIGQISAGQRREILV